MPVVFVSAGAAQRPQTTLMGGCRWRLEPAVIGRDGAPASVVDGERRGWPAGPRALRAGAGIKQRAQASRPRGAVAGRPPGQASGRRRGKRAGLAGPEGVFLPFFSNQMFIKFYFLHFHF